MLRTFLLFLAHKEGFKNFALKFKFFRNTASRFVAGETLDAAIAAVRQVNAQNIAGTLDLLGENTLTREDALAACRDVMEILNRIRDEKVDCNVSVKLTQLGLALDPEFAHQNLLQVVRRARETGSFIRVDMEDSPYTQITLDLVRKVHEQLDNVGTVIQAYLYRSGKDIRDLIREGIRVRLVKGAYLEPETIAFRKKQETDANFVQLMQQLLQAKTYNAIATHDEAIIQSTEKFARTQNIPKDRFEFQMLYGIRRDLQARLAQEGYRVRIYIPFGQRWYPYFMRRLAERPANVLFILRNILKD